MKDVALKSYETLNPMRHLTWRHRFTTPHLSMRILYLLRRMSKLREIRVFRVKNEQFPLATSSNVLVTVKIKQNKEENTRSLNLYDTDQTSITPTNVWSVHTLSN